MASVQSPEAFFGYRLGSDRNLARWDRIVEYFHLLEQSGRVKVIDMGPSTEGNPFLLVYISSEENLWNLDHYRAINNRLADPRGLSEVEAEKLIADGRSVILQSMSLHATEVGGTQMAPELAYEITRRRRESGRTSSSSWFPALTQTVRS
jgi:hypothetical protein